MNEHDGTWAAPTDPATAPVEGAPVQGQPYSGGYTAYVPAQATRQPQQPPAAPTQQPAYEPAEQPTAYQPAAYQPPTPPAPPGYDVQPAVPPNMPAAQPPFVPTWSVAPQHSVRRRRPRLLLILGIGLPVLLLIAAAVVWKARPQTDAHYVSALQAAHVSGEYANDTAAIAHAKGFCRELNGGHALEGYDGEKIGVQFYCGKFLPGFKVIPTPEQLQAKYLAALRDAGFGGEYPSDAAAVAHAQSICNGLDNGDKQQGMPVDQIGVDAYCPKFSAGFHVLETATIKGSFTLRDSSPSDYYPSITSTSDGCEGSGGYSDIGPGTTVLIKNSAGKLLAETELGPGTGGYYSCRFLFSVDLTEGEDDYVVTVSHRGDLHYTFETLKSDGISATLGS